MDKISFGGLDICFHRTVQVEPNSTSNLPPSLGRFELYSVKNYRDKCPRNWDDNGYFIAMHEKEATWISFNNSNCRSQPCAIIVGAGGINALTGEKLGIRLEKDNYLVTPPQPWLDGWKDQDGTVYQFVVTEYKKGEGLSVGEQILKSESCTGGVGLAVFDLIEPVEIKEQYPSESLVQFAAGDANLDLFYDNLAYSICDSDYECEEVVEMGVGKGGKIHQKIYPDPYGLEKWRKEPAFITAIYLVNAKQFSQITGQPMPPLPVAAGDYHSAWYGLHDKDKGDIQGSHVFSELKSVFPGTDE